MGTLLAIAIGGALGSLARHGVTILFEKLLGGAFPYGILVSNITGSFLVGIALVLVIEKGFLPDMGRPLLMVGFLGGFTTFSAFSLQVTGLLTDGRLAAAAVYVGGSLLLGIAGAATGILLARFLIRP